MKLFNTKTQQIEPFQPNGNEVTLLYMNGMTPHDTTHLAHAFTTCTADVLVRYLERKGWLVRYGQFVTGIDDDVAQKAQTWTQPFTEDMQSLNVHPPDYVLRTTEAIPQIIDIYMGSTGFHPQNAYIRFWLHTATMEHGDHKTGKPPGDQVLVRDILQRYPPDVLRIYLAQRHYRQLWTHNEVALEKAAHCVEKLKAAMTAVSTGQQTINITPAQKRFVAAMDNDLDTSKGIATLLNLADEILFRAPNDYQIDEAQETLRRMATVFGLRLNRE
jgi:cysteinyl-tRNA synthetase